MIKKMIEIHNVGPIKKVCIELNKINVFMGAQSSGKSTIAKIISYCNYIEKEVSLYQSLDKYNLKDDLFISKLQLYHGLRGYFKNESKITFNSETIYLEYTSQLFTIKWNNKYTFINNEIIYIPYERNVVNILDTTTLKLPDNYLRSFLYKWFDARKKYEYSNHLNLLHLGVNYYFSASSKSNMISSNSDHYDIPLSYASSGIQSLTPLIVLIDYLTNENHKLFLNESYDDIIIKNDINLQLLVDVVLKPIFNKYYQHNTTENKDLIIQEIFNKYLRKDKLFEKQDYELTRIKDNLYNIHGCNMIIEEPEQNLFPATQKELIYYLLSKINSNDNNQLTLTTHSPYVLYAINNCIIASIASETNKITVSDKINMSNLYKAKTNPNDISIFQLKNGYIECIQEEDGLIGNNFFDTHMKEVMDDYYSMLKYL